MNDLFSTILLLGITVIIGFFLFYIFRSYFAPKKLEELAEMIRLGHYGPAIRKLNSIIEQDERDIQAHFLLGEAYRLQAKYPQAITEYKMILKIGRFTNRLREEAVRSKLAALYLKINSLDEAKNEFLILTKLEPMNAENFYQVGLLFKNAGLADKAINYFRQASKVNPAHENALLHNGIMTYQQGGLLDAKKSLSQAVQLNPNLYEGHYYLGLCLKNQKDYDWAIKEFNMALRDPKLKAKAHLAKGLAHFEREEFEKAAQEFERGLGHTQAKSSTELNLRYFLGLAAERMRDLHTAIANWELIHDVNPKYKDVPEKLKTYADFRTEDTIKDFMIAAPTMFEEICKRLIGALELDLLEIQVENDIEVRAMATESEAKWRNSKISNRLIYIFRTTDPITEKVLRNMHEEMRKRSATKGICMATSSFTSQADLFSLSRPIELIDKTKMITYLRLVNNA